MFFLQRFTDGGVCFKDLRRQKPQTKKQRSARCQAVKVDCILQTVLSEVLVSGNKVIKPPRHIHKMISAISETPGEEVGHLTNEVGCLVSQITNTHAAC